jgi:hypothetical protein
MNTNDIIQEAAEAWLELELLKCDKPKEYYSKGVLNDVTNSYNRHCTHFLTHTKEKHGAELVKVEGEGEDEIVKNLHHVWLISENIGVYEIVRQALAIGREQGRKEVQKQHIIDLMNMDEPPKTDL